MVHQYKLNGYNIVLDTCSGSVHVVDEVAYDIIALYPEKTPEEIVSAILAFSRSFVFILITMLVLPALLGVTGIWLATPVAEGMALVLGAAMFLKYRTRYHY